MTGLRRVPVLAWRRVLGGWDASPTRRRLVLVVLPALGWSYCGTSDDHGWQNREFNAELARLGVAHHFFELPGTRTWRLWRGTMPQALVTASERLSHG